MYLHLFHLEQIKHKFSKHNNCIIRVSVYVLCVLSARASAYCGQSWPHSFTSACFEGWMKNLKGWFSLLNLCSVHSFFIIVTVLSDALTPRCLGCACAIIIFVRFSFPIGITAHSLKLEIIMITAQSAEKVSVQGPVFPAAGGPHLRRYRQQNSSRLPVIMTGGYTWPHSKLLDVWHAPEWTAHAQHFAV